MNKRALGIRLGSIAIAAAGFVIGRSVVSESQAAANRNTVTWEVPPGVTKVRVRSWKSDGSKDIDRVLSVEPNQTFRIDVVN